MCTQNFQKQNSGHLTLKTCAFSSEIKFHPGIFITQYLHLNMYLPLNIYLQEVTTNLNIFGAIIKSMINARIWQDS